MAVEHVKSTPVTNLDATPVAKSTTGQGAAATLKEINSGLVTVTASSSIDSTYQMVRVPFDAVIKELDAHLAAHTTTGQIDIGVYYATDNSNQLSASSLLAADAIDQDLFTIAVLDPDDQAVYAHLVPGGGFSISGATPAILENTVWTRAHANQPLWEVLGLSSNPGGNADICFTYVEAVGAATAAVSLSVKYTD